MKTLRNRVLFGTTAAVAVVGILSAWTLYALVERSLVGELDRAQAAKARVLASGVTQAGRNLAIEFVELDLEEFADPECGEFLELWTAGHLLYRFPLPEEEPTFRPPAEPAELVSEWVDLEPGARGRVVTLSFQPLEEEPEDEDESGSPIDDVEAPVERAQLALVLARDASAIDEALATLRMLLALVGVVTLASTGAVLSWVVHRSLRPVAAVSDRVAAIAEDSLSTRLDPTGVPGELLPVVGRVNGLLERLEAAFERERAFSNDVAHELRTPLAGLRTTLEVTAARIRSEAEYTEALATSATIVGQLQAMVERLLQLARLDGGRTAVPSEPYVLGDMAVEVWESFAAQAQSRGLHVDLSMENGLEIGSDRELVELVLRNLYENAVTYADPGGEIRISTHRSNGREVALEVSNTGNRLSSDEIATATSRFWRGDAARTEVGLHCGLGLSLVEKAIGALAGRLELLSRPDGEFAVVVTLPLP